MKDDLTKDAAAEIYKSLMKSLAQLPGLIASIDNLQSQMHHSPCEFSVEMSEKLAKLQSKLERAINDIEKLTNHVQDPKIASQERIYIKEKIDTLENNVTTMNKELKIIIGIGSLFNWLIKNIKPISVALATISAVVYMLFHPQDTMAILKIIMK